MSTIGWSRIWFLVGTIGGVMACGGGGEDTCTVTAVSVTASAGSVTTGQSSTLTATVSSQGTCAGGVTWQATPAGGSLTPNGLVATFIPSAAGTYTVTATSTDDPARSDSATVVAVDAVACGEPNGTVVVHSSNISADETWAGDNVTHSVPTNISILAPATVTIQPCAIVALGPNVSITVRGNVAGGQTAKLIAAGESADRFVSFVRANTSQAWGILRGFDERAEIELRHAVLRGGGAFGGQYRNPAIAMSGPGYGSLPAELLKVEHVVVDGPVGAGVFLDANAAFTADSDDLTIENASDHPFVVTMMSLGSLPGGDYTSNAVQETLIIGPGTVFADVTVRKRLPVRIAYGQMTIAAPANETQTVTLTVEPGVIFRFPPLPGPQPGARVTFGSNGNPPNNKVGVLRALGTQAEPIVFTSGAATPAPGDWVGLWLDTSNGSRLDHVVIEYAGAPNGIGSNNCRPMDSNDNAALVVGDFSDQYVPPPDLITNSVIANTAGHGINAAWVSGAFAPNLTDPGNMNTFTSVAGCEQTLNGLDGVCTMRGCQP